MITGGLGFRVYLTIPKPTVLDVIPYDSGVITPKGPCTQIVYTLALRYSLYRYIGPKVYTTWVHGPLGNLLLCRAWRYR